MTLLVLIAASTLIILLESIPAFHNQYFTILLIIEWSFTILFTIEYILRLISVCRPVRYATSFYGLVDLLAIHPTYPSILFPGGKYFLVIRAIRLLRIFRIFKLAKYLNEANNIMRAARQSTVLQVLRLPPERA